MNKYVKNFARYRYLLIELVKKGIKLKYRRSYLGLIWTMLEPLLTMIVLTIVFGQLLGKGDRLYPVYILSGRLIYSCFSSSTKIAMRSIRANQAMIKKVYVPKYLYPLSSCIYNYILFLLSLIVLAVVSIVLGVPLTWHVIEAVIPCLFCQLVQEWYCQQYVYSLEIWNICGMLCWCLLCIAQQFSTKSQVWDRD